jgi:trehalose 6-phosphate phosphatase
MAVELRPPVPVDKGTVTAELVTGASVAVFAGDDAGDLVAFDVLTRLAETGAVAHTVRIGVRSAEAPPGIFDADVVVDGPEGLAQVLGDLVSGISARG